MNAPGPNGTGLGRATRLLPKMVPLGMAGLVVLALAGATGARLSGYRPTDDYAAAVASRSLRFSDEPDGAVLVTDAGSGQAVGTVAPETNGFLRATVRGLVNARKRAGDSQPDTPFVLSLRADGALIFQDPANGRTLDLNAFGQTNADAFARFLPGTPLRSTGTL